MSAPAPAAASRPRPLEPAGRTSTFLPACRGEATRVTPVWFMRQAGRALPEYRELRRAMSMFELIRRPDAAAEATLQPVRRYGVDAAILFSDITTPLEAVGLDVQLVEGIGPVFGTPFRSGADLAALRVPDEADLAHVVETVRLATDELSIPLIAFAGAPFTVASYLIEGRPSKTHATAKSMMLADPALWARLLDRLADIAIAFLKVQVEAGAEAVQLFDSWAGSLSPAMYVRHVLPASRKVLTALAGVGVPSIHFGVGTGELLEPMAAAGADVMGVDWRVPIADARRRLPGLPVQGNLDPVACLAPWPVVEQQAREVIDGNAGRPGHIFNLGHGVLPDTDPGVLAALVAWVHEHRWPQR